MDDTEAALRIHSAWDNKFAKADRRSSDVWVIKLHFNPIWEDIDIHKVDKVFKETLARAKLDWESNELKAFSILSAWGESGKVLLVKAGRAYSTPWVGVKERLFSLGDMDSLVESFARKTLLVSWKKNQQLIDVLNTEKKLQLSTFHLSQLLFFTQEVLDLEE
ncbi:hypothetical protein BOTBODRAFT_44339 [Botryobasidium botryosum FD-172 SS1]|uniref:Uncharacterized protein n=1 Tax=Botryobasidium botryosum (strain FD-172 SS1) TaxID=930990 RepID=A0A067MHA5_BOTB1|nr:hypothetical protein BOTBODRAFT_44339 [Botryobasidium botryosum FD-172 SS1]